MSKCQVGVVLNQAELDQVKQECPHLRVIQARWVTAFKSAERVRARIVAKDLRTKDSARSLGCSSPTPSCEVVNLILALTSSRGWRLRALDISHAFMHSPLPRGTRIALKLPQSVSSVEGLPFVFGFAQVPQWIEGCFTSLVAATSTDDCCCWIMER